MLGFIEQYITEAIGALLGGFVGWFFTRQSSELDNVDKAVRIYREMVDNLGNKLSMAIAELDAAKETIKELEQKVEALTIELTKYKQLNGKAKT